METKKTNEQQNFEAAEKLFLELTAGMKICEQEKYPDSFYWEDKNGEIIFQKENMNLWCHYDKIWNKFYPFFDDKYLQIRDFISDMMKKHYKWKGLTPSDSRSNFFLRWKNIINKQ